MQTKIYNPKTQKNDVLTVIEISTESPETAADKVFKLEKTIGGKNSYMNFKVYAAPVGGAHMITVETTYPATEKKIRDFLMYLLFYALTK